MKQPLNENKSLPTEKPVASSDAGRGHAKVRCCLSLRSVPGRLWAAFYLQGRPRRL